MMRLKDFIKLAEKYGEDAEVYVEVSENSKLHFSRTDGSEVVELNGATLTSFKEFKTNNGDEGIILRLPMWVKTQ